MEGWSGAASPRGPGPGPDPEAAAPLPLPMPLPPTLPLPLPSPLPLPLPRAAAARPVGLPAEPADDGGVGYRDESSLSSLAALLLLPLATGRRTSSSDSFLRLRAAEKKDGG